LSDSQTYFGNNVKIFQKNGSIFQMSLRVHKFRCNFAAQKFSFLSQLNSTMTQEPKVRYSDDELQEFKELIDGKLVQAQEELDTTQRQIADLNENGFNQQGGDWYDDSGAHTDMEMLQRMLVRQQRYVQDLRNALLRIKNKSYGICSVTGVLIDKNRLRLVPHATKSMDGKAIAGTAKTTPATDADREPFALGDGDRPAGKPIGDKVRMGNTKRSPNGEDWEPDNENMEDAGYTRRKFEGDDEE
jgi:RNA polymerase-binding transcription factor DksA